MREARTSLNSSHQVSTWPLEKKYAAALFFLNRVPSPVVSEAQYHRLHALMLQINYGSFIPSGRLPEFASCSTTDRKKRETEWKAVQHLPKVPAMKVFVDLMSELHPNWHKHRQIFEDFELIWAEERFSQLSKQGSQVVTRKSGGSVHDRLYSQSVKGNVRERKIIRAPNIVTAAIAQLQQYDEKRIGPLSPKLPKLSATLDAAHTVSSVKGAESPKELHDVHSESRYYHLPTTRGFKPEEEFQHAKSVLENYFSSINSGKGSLNENKNLGFEIRSDMEKSLSQMLQHVQAMKTPPVSSKDSHFPFATANQLRVFLRPKLEIPSIVLDDLDKILSASLGSSPTILAQIAAELNEAIDSVFDYVCDMESSMKDLGEQSKALERDFETVLDVIKAIQELHSVNNQKLELFGVTKASKSEYEVRAAKGLLELKGDAKKRLEELELELRSQKAEFFDVESKLSNMELEKDKLIDELRLPLRAVTGSHLLLCFTLPFSDRGREDEAQQHVVQQSAYSDNIALSNIAKDLKRSVGIIQGGEGRGSSHELALKKEIEELKKELLQLKRENDSLRSGQPAEGDYSPQTDQL